MRQAALKRKAPPPTLSMQCARLVRNPPPPSYFRTRQPIRTWVRLLLILLPLLPLVVCAHAPSSSHLLPAAAAARPATHMRCVPHASVHPGLGRVRIVATTPSAL